MRNFIISLICITILSALWGGFSLYSSKMSEQCIQKANTLISHSISNEDWDAAEDEFSQVEETWNQYKRFAYFFLDTKDISEIDAALDKTLLYIEAHDVSNSTGEISYLASKFRSLHQNDALILRNLL